MNKNKIMCSHIVQFLLYNFKPTQRIECFGVFLAAGLYSSWSEKFEWTN